MTQPLSLLEQLRKLEKLQEIDLKIDLLKKNQSGLPTALKALDLTIHRLKTSQDEKKSLLGELDKSARQTHAAIDLNQERLTRSGGKLEQVHNSQEFQAVNKEIEQLKKLNGSLAEQEKKAISDIETLTLEIAEMEEVLQKALSERQTHAEEVSGQDNQLNSDIGSLVSERTQFCSEVDKKMVAQYNRVRAARNGIGIVPAFGGRCRGCNMMVPPQMFNELQKGTIAHSCPSCNRLLFLPEVSPEDATQQKI